MSTFCTFALCILSNWNQTCDLSFYHICLGNSRLRSRACNIMNKATENKSARRRRWKSTHNANKSLFMFCDACNSNYKYKHNQYKLYSSACLRSQSRSIATFSRSLSLSLISSTASFIIHVVLFAFSIYDLSYSPGSFHSIGALIGHNKHLKRARTIIIDQHTNTIFCGLSPAVIKTHRLQLRAWGDWMRDAKDRQRQRTMEAKMWKRCVR